MSSERTHVEYFFDPACPFCWVTSKWIRQVQASDYPLDVTWRFISLAILNEKERERPSDGHARGLRLLRIASAIGEAEGNEAVGRFYEEIGNRLWETAPPIPDEANDSERKRLVSEHQERAASDVAPVLAAIGLDAGHADAAEETIRDEELRISTEEALSRTGPDVGTPIIAFDPPDGPAFFGPVISSVADPERSVELWEAVETLAFYPSMAELKRSLRETPDTALLRAASGE